MINNLYSCASLQFLYECVYNYLPNKINVSVLHTVSKDVDILLN